MKIKLLLISVMIIAMSCSMTKKQNKSMSVQNNNWEYMNDTVKWNAFLDCSNNSGGWSCDSCFYAIYKINIEDAMSIDSTGNIVYWIDDVRNPYNHEWIIETAFNNDVSYDSVTQKMFNERYLSRHK